VNELALFAGAGGGILGGQLLGWHCVCAVECDAYAVNVLAQRQNDGTLETFPIWSDVRTFDGKEWAGCVDLVSCGFPCVDISCAGKGAGITGKDSGLWKEAARIIGEVRPRYAFIENSPMLAFRGLDTVLCDLAAMGFDAEWGVISAEGVGAPHKRERIWIMAYASSERGRSGDGNWQDAMDVDSCCKRIRPLGSREWWATEPELGRLANGIPHRLHRHRVAGNAQVPLAHATAWRILGGS